jgi:F-type H+-transporting ATPase subunit c
MLGHLGSAGQAQRRKEVRRKLLLLLTVVMGLLVAVPVFAQTPTAGGSAENTKWVIITAGFAMAIASAVCGYAQSKATAAACEGLARNPGARPGIQFALILALILIESMALYTFAIIFMKVTA